MSNDVFRFSLARFPLHLHERRWHWTPFRNMAEASNAKGQNMQCSSLHLPLQFRSSHRTVSSDNNSLYCNTNSSSQFRRAHGYVMPSEESPLLSDESLPGSCWFSELHDLECLCSNLLQRRDFLFYWCLCSELTFHSPLNISLWEPFQVF